MRAALLLLCMTVSGCQCSTTSVPAPAPAPQCVPRILAAQKGTPSIDGELDEAVWHAAEATSPFVNDKQKRVVPHTEARASWDDEALYLVLYTADEDLRSDDRVLVTFEGGTIELAPQQTMTCRFGAQPDCTGITTKFEVDGDVDANGEEDEEWVAELKVPWKLIAPGGRPAQLPVNFSRLETLEGAHLREVWSRTCGAIRLD